MDQALNVPLELEIEKMAVSLRGRVLNFESSLKAVANEIRQLCLDKEGNCFQALSLIEPWKAEDETASVLVSHLSSGDEKELVGRARFSAQVCSQVFGSRRASFAFCWIVREWLHPAHVSAFCQKLLCGGEEINLAFMPPMSSLH
ncbi:hypothetical protein CRYUN_Cryun26dG0054000 [Craigia yunnanensis]